jgi:hypothetical protein
MYFSSLRCAWALDYLSTKEKVINMNSIFLIRDHASRNKLGNESKIRCESSRASTAWLGYQGCSQWKETDTMCN